MTGYVDDKEQISQIDINHFIGLVFQTGTECLKKREGTTMGEARRRAELGLPPRLMNPTQQPQQIPIGPEILKHAVARVCKCGCKFFIPVIHVSTISALVSPIGQELTTQTPVLICLKCQEPLNLKPETLDASDPPQEGAVAP